MSVQLSIFLLYTALLLNHIIQSITIIQYYYKIRQQQMSLLGNQRLQKSKQRQLAIRRAQFLKKIKIKVKSAQKILDQDHLIMIETFNVQKNRVVELVMRKLSQLDNLIAHMKIQYGGHIIPLFNHDLFFQDNAQMDKIVPDIQQYLNDLKNNKYCRQDVKFYCFMIQQNTSFPKQMGFERMISNATDKSRKYLNQLFTRREVHSLKDTAAFLHSKQQLNMIIQNYVQVKELTLSKIKQILIFQQISEVLTQMCGCPGVAVEPQEFDMEFIFKIIKTCQKLINQARQSFVRWELLADSVKQLQNNVYKGLHQFQTQLNQTSDQLKEWSESLSRQFNQLGDYISQKIQALSASLYKLNKKFIDVAVFSGQGIPVQQEVIQQHKGKQQNGPYKNQMKQYDKKNGHKQIKQAIVEEIRQNKQLQANLRIQINKQENRANQQMQNYKGQGTKV